MPQIEVGGRKFGHRTAMRVAAGIALAAVIACAGTATARADDDSISIYDRLMRTLGVKFPGTMQDGINYSERSPLVVPPTRDLPKPVTTTAPPAPNWPKDPDMQRRAAARAARKVTPHADYVVDSSRPLRPDELNVPGPNTHSASNADSTANSQQSNPTDRGVKKSIFSFDWFKKEEYATFTGEPPRANLTDPPPGYLTPSPDEPYGVGPEKKQQYKIPTVADRAEPVSGTAASTGK